MGRSFWIPTPPRQGHARSSAHDRSSPGACLSWQKIQGREANRRCHRLTEPTTKALREPHPPTPFGSPPLHPISRVAENGIYSQTISFGPRLGHKRWLGSQTPAPPPSPQHPLQAQPSGWHGSSASPLLLPLPPSRPPPPPSPAPHVTVRGMTVLGENKQCTTGTAASKSLAGDMTDEQCAGACTGTQDCVAAETTPGGANGKKRCHLWRGFFDNIGVSLTNTSGATCYQRVLYGMRGAGLGDVNKNRAIWGDGGGGLWGGVANHGHIHGLRSVADDGRDMGGGGGGEGDQPPPPPLIDNTGGGSAGDVEGRWWGREVLEWPPPPQAPGRATERRRGGQHAALCTQHAAPVGVCTVTSGRFVPAPPTTKGVVYCFNTSRAVLWGLDFFLCKDRP